MQSVILDLVGLKCPLPVLKVKKAMKDLQAGARLEIYVNDPLSVIDIPAYCNETGHQLIERRDEDDRYVFKIECVRAS